MSFYFSNIDDFLAMGGHGFYVWISYAIAITTMIFYFMLSAKQTNKKQKELAKFYQRLESRQSKNKRDS